MKPIPAKAAILALRQALSALDHPVRQRILALLYTERRALSYSQIAKRLGFDDSSMIAHHLKVLVGAALVGNELQRVEGRIGSLYFISDAGKDWLEKTGLAQPERMVALLRAS